jgi:hypothetical protein
MTGNLFATRWWRALVGAIVTAGVLFLIVFFFAYRDASADSNASAVSVINSAHVEHLLDPHDFGAGAIGTDLGVTAAPAIALALDGKLRAVDRLDSISPRVREIEVIGQQPDSFALDSNGAMLAVAGGYFGVMDESGQIEEGVPLPFSGMRVAPSSHAGAVYLFGGAAKNYRLYRFIDDGTLQVVLETDVPIVAAADNGTAIYAATASAILKIKAGTPDVAFRAPEGETIQSLAIGKDGLVFFSTSSKVYALLGPNALSIVNDAGGTLRVRNGVLYVLDSQRRILFNITPASSQLFSEIRE